MSRLSRRQHSRREQMEVKRTQYEAGVKAQHLSTIEMFRLAGVADKHEFRDYDMRRDKIWYDVVTKDARLFFQCYPNANSWTAMGEYNKTWTKLTDDDVAMIRPSKTMPFESLPQREEWSRTKMPASPSALLP